MYKILTHISVYFLINNNIYIFFYNFQGDTGPAGPSGSTGDKGQQGESGKEGPQVNSNKIIICVVCTM